VRVLGRCRGARHRQFLQGRGLDPSAQPRSIPDRRCDLVDQRSCSLHMQGITRNRASASRGATNPSDPRPPGRPPAEQRRPPNPRAPPRTPPARGARPRPRRGSPIRAIGSPTASSTCTARSTSPSANATRARSVWVNREYRWAWPGGVRTSEMRSSQREAASRAPAASSVCSRAHANAPTAPKLCAPASIRIRRGNSELEALAPPRHARRSARGGTMCSRPDRARSDSPPRRSPRRPHRRAPVPHVVARERSSQPRALTISPRASRSPSRSLILSPSSSRWAPRRPPIHAAFAVQSRSVHAARRRVDPR